MENLTASVLAGIGSALVVLGGYHFLVARPRLGRVEGMLGTHDGLLGGGGAEPPRAACRRSRNPRPRPRASSPR